MMITKMALPRRTFLRGMGTALALPLLDAMVPALTAISKSAAVPARRLGVVYLPNGMAMDFWTPALEGPAFELSPVLQPLSAFRDQLLVLSGLNGPRGGGAHAGASTLFLTGVGGKAGEIGVEASVSIDQILAKQLGHHTQLASLELALDGRDNAGSCDAGYSCAYSNTISWRGATTPLPMENNPRVVFERLFGDSGTTDSATRLAMIRRDRSLLDSVTEKVAELGQRVGPSDRRKIDEFLEGVRDVERRIQKAEEQSANELPVVAQPAGIPATFEEHARLMYDLQVLAYQCDLTRVTTFMLGRELSGRTYPEIGVPDSHHPLSHHEDVAEKIALMAKINVFHAALFAQHLEKLRATADGDGTLLDHTILMYGAGISNSNSHDHNNLPILLVGGKDHIQGGRHAMFKGQPLANLLVSVMDKLGAPIEQIGNSSGRLEIDPIAI
jgi:hypothetical protein